MSRAGFTLLELLVGIVVLGLILLGLTGGARYGLRAAQTQSRIADARGDLDVVDRSLRRLLASARPGTGGGVAFQGGAGTLRFASVLPGEVAGEVGLGVDASRRLVLRTTPRLPGRPFGPAPAPDEAELAAGVAGLNLSYWTAAEGGRWVSAWGEPSLPALVRVRIAFPAGDARHWPDLVFATARQRAGEEAGAGPRLR